jgi:hypothetical protein
LSKPDAAEVFPGFTQETEMADLAGAGLCRLLTAGIPGQETPPTPEEQYVVVEGYEHPGGGIYSCAV